MQNDGTLPAHLDRFSAPGIEMSAGALGHGLSVGLGISHGCKLKEKNNRVFVLMGDGEIQEGSVWEAAMMAPMTGANNLVAMVDCNNLQGYGRPREIMCVEPMLEKWRAFGWYAVDADGHDFHDIHRAVKSATLSEQPSVILFNTIKGKGVSFMEDQLKWHYYIVTDEILEQAMKELAHA
jgi:transketolase